jgi:tetratricopeptide (TPR) repeat protein
MKRIILFVIFCLISYYAFPSLAEVLFNSGLNFYNSGDYDNAIDRLTKIFEEYPESSLFPKSCFYLGLIYYDKGQYDLAKRYLLISTKRLEKGSLIWIKAMETLGVIYYEEGNDDKYQKIFSELSRIKDKNLYLDRSAKHDKGLQVKKVLPSYTNSQSIAKSFSTNDSFVVTNFVFYTNYVTNTVYLTNSEELSSEKVLVYTNYLTNFVTNYSPQDLEVSSNFITNLLEVKGKVDEINKKEEQLEELNRLTDIKNRLLKLSEKALLIQELINKKMEVSNR